MIKSFVFIKLVLFIVFFTLPLTAQSKPDMINFKAMYIDMDRTLLDSEHKILPEVAKALKKYQKCGGVYGIATGRGPDQIKEHLLIIKPDLPFVFNNGGLVMTSDLKKVIKVNSFPNKVLSVVRTLKPVFEDKIIGITLATNNGVVVDRDDKTFSKFIGKFGFTPNRTDTSLTLLRNELPIILMFWTKPSEENNVKETLNKKAGKMTHILAGPESVFITAKGVDKAEGIEQALLGTGLVLEKDVVVIGDSGNDVGMLEKARYGFAMKNCKKKACDAADAIIGSNDTNAIANLINNIAISQWCK